MNDFRDALDKVLLGAACQLVMPEDERVRTAYHEAGHAILGLLVPGRIPSARCRSCRAAWRWA